MALATVSAVSGDPTVENRLLQVITTHQVFDPLMPWQKSPPAAQYGYGIDLGGGRVLTTENLVRNHTLVELLRARSGEKIRAEVELSDPQVNLAILRWTDGNLPAAGGGDPEWIDHISPTQTFTILQFDETRQIQKGSAQLLQIAMTPLPRADDASLSFKLLMNLNVDGQGAPVLVGNRLAGLMMSFSDSTRTGHMVPYPVVARFLALAKAAPYSGFAAAGFTWRPLVDPVRRTYLRVQHPGKGVQILSCIPYTGAAETLRTDDVILAWDGYPIDDLGFYTDPEFGRLNLAYLIKGRRIPGDTVPVTLVRDGHEIEVAVPLARMLDQNALIPENITNERPEYLVQGGLLIRELTGRYLRSHGSRWEHSANTRLVQLYSTRRNAPSSPGERVVILSRVLPHPVNLGYHMLNDQIVTAVNGIPVRNMPDVFRVVAEGGLRRVTLKSVGIDLIIDPDMLPRADADVARQYGVSQLRFQRPEEDPTAKSLH